MYVSNAILETLSYAKISFTGMYVRAGIQNIRMSNFDGGKIFQNINAIIF